MRFPLEVIAAVRKAVGPDFTLGVRLCADELIPGGLNLEDAKQITQRDPGDRALSTTST